MKLSGTILLLLALLFCAEKSYAQTDQKIFDSLDSYAKKAPKEYEENIKKLAAYLIIPAKTDEEKARVIYSWIATHVKYDASAFNANKYPDPSASNVLKKKKAVCEGYSNLMNELCSEAGLQCEKIVGYSKGYGYKEGHKFKKSDHAWNAIKIGDKWRLMDVTWGSGYGTNADGKLKVTTLFDPYWFDVDPKQFIFSHLPEEEKWQLLDEPITLKKYEKLPHLADAFFKLGFETDKVYEDAMSGNVEEFIDVFSTTAAAKAIQLPYSKKIMKEDATTFIMQSDQALEIVLIDGKEWVKFEKEGNTFTLSHTPKHKKVSIGMKTKKSGKGLESILEYKAGK